MENMGLHPEEAAWLTQGLLELPPQGALLGQEKPKKVGVKGNSWLGLTSSNFPDQFRGQQGQPEGHQVPQIARQGIGTGERSLGFRGPRLLGLESIHRQDRSTSSRWINQGA